jgi:DNA-binding GntR family transcriptional regulator
MAEMEATCARLCALSMTPVERRRLQARHEAMTELAAHGNPDAYSNANVAFHSAIYAGAHNASLAEFAMGLRRRVGPFRRAQFRMEGRLTRSNQEHDAVVRAILAGDAPAAHAAMLHHVSLVEDAFEAFAAINAA